jgi:hypothetical protein
MESSETVPMNPELKDKIAISTCIAGFICFVIGVLTIDWFAIFGGLAVIIVGLALDKGSD